MLSSFKLVEVEIHSFCNRKCPWCPNKKIDRTKKNEMPEDLYLKIMKELRDNNFKGYVTYSRNNEPLSDADLLKKRVKQAKEIIPGIKCITNTNGDFVTSGNLDGLLIDELSIMDYDGKGYDRCLSKLQEIGASIVKWEKPYIYAVRGDMKIIYLTDWAENVPLEHRGGFFNSDSKIIHKGKELKFRNDLKRRTFWCDQPSRFIGIDYTGDVTPCCAIRHDFFKHKPYILGNVNENDLVNILYSEKAIKIRDILTNGLWNKYPEPCTYCQKVQGRYTKENPTIVYSEEYICEK